MHISKLSVSMNSFNDQDKFLSICQNGSLEDLQHWFDQKPRFRINQADNATGNTGLHMTALSEGFSRAKTEVLIQNGANPLVRNDICETPAHNAAIAGNLETLKLLVDKGGLSGILMGNLQNSREMKFKANSRQNSRKGIWTTKSPPASSVQVNMYLFLHLHVIPQYFFSLSILKKIILHIRW